jgi:hypothetical protein
MTDRENFTYVHRAGIAFSQRDTAPDKATSVMVSVLVLPQDSTATKTWKGDKPMHVLKPELDEQALHELVRQRQEAVEHRKALEEVIDNLNGEIGAMMDLAGVKSTQSGEWMVTLSDRTTPSRLIPEKLLDQGVPADVIAAATEPGRPYTSVMIRKAKE